MHELSEGGWITGKVLLHGEDIYDPGIDAVSCGAASAWCFQRPTPFPTMSIYDNVADRLRVERRRPRAEMDAAVKSALRRARSGMKLKDRLRPNALASRAASSSASAWRGPSSRPEVLLLDEPRRPSTRPAPSTSKSCVTSSKRATPS